MNSNYKIRKIAVATDFSAASENALLRGFELSEVFGAGIDIIHAVSPAESKNKKAIFVSAAYERLKNAKEGLGQNNTAGVFARVGEVDEFVYHYCVKHHIDLLITGTTAGDRKLFSNSTVYQIIMKVECPVLSIPVMTTRLQLNKILFPVRNVTGIKEKLLYCLPYAQKMGSVLQMMMFGLPQTDQIRSVTLLAEEEGILFFPPDWDRLNNKDIAAQVVEAAQITGAELIVINATSEKEWYQLPGENYTEFLLRESRIPLLSITHQFQSKGS